MNGIIKGNGGLGQTMIKGTTPNSRSTTGVKYLNVDRGYIYIVRVQIKKKHFVMWKGTDKSIGEKIAKKVQSVILKGESAFLDWYDYEREEWLKELKDNGY